VVGKTTVGPLC